MSDEDEKKDVETPLNPWGPEDTVTMGVTPLQERGVLLLLEGVVVGAGELIP